jgi:hypothetical protein
MLSFLKKCFSGTKPPAPNPNNNDGNVMPPSKRQREECDYLGLTIEPNMTWYSVSWMIINARENPKYKALSEAYIATKNAASKKKQLEKLFPGTKRSAPDSNSKDGNAPPPGKMQREECEFPGVTIEPNITLYSASGGSTDAREDKALNEAWIAKKNAAFEKKKREEYGDALIDELKKWKKICYPDQYFVIYQTGKTMHSDIVEFKRAYIVNALIPYVKIDALLPSIQKPHNCRSRMEWEKEVSFRSMQIFKCIKLQKKIDKSDVDGYELMLIKRKLFTNVW